MRKALGIISLLLYCTFLIMGFIRLFEWIAPGGLLGVVVIGAMVPVAAVLIVAGGVGAKYISGEYA